MSAAYWAHPEWLPALIAILAGIAAWVAAGRLLARRRRQRLLGSAAAPRPQALRSDALLLAALAALCAALLGPRIGEREERVPASGVDVVFLVDLSHSMDARDVPPSRLDRARRGGRELLARLAPRDRAALAAFGGSGVVLTPLTPDHGALAELLDALDTDLIHPPASDLGAGVAAALGAFEAGSERPRVLFVLSDGEDPRRGGVGAPDVARAEVRVLAAALGSDAGATIPDYGVPLRDASGRAVVTRRQRERLQRLVGATGGALFVGDAWGAFDYDRAAAEIRRDAAAAPGDTFVRRVTAVRVLPFAALAFALLLAEGLPRPRLPALPRRRLAPAGAAVALLLVGASEPTREAAPGETAALEERVRAQPGDAALLIELGLARLERGRSDAAARAFLAASVYARDPRAAAVAYYDLGVAELTRGELSAARDAFFDALAVAPGNARARFNLEWTLRALQAGTPPPAPLPLDAPETEPRPEPPPPEAAPGQQPAEPEPRRLSEAERRRWLDRVEDDPARAARGALGEPERGRRRGGPAW